MKHLRSIVLAALLALLAGCTVQTQAATADAIADGANAAGALLARRETAETRALLTDIESRAEGEAIARAQQQRWEPLWLAFDALAAIHAQWADGLEQGRAAGPELVAAAYHAWCQLEAAATDRGVDIPHVIPCGGAP